MFKMQLKHLPAIELSYDNILHKKVSADMYLLIPKGKTVLAWFTYFKNQNICLILHINKYGKIIKTESYYACFSDDLSLGTILQGTLFVYNGQTFFTCEDIYYYKGNSAEKYSYEKKFKIFDLIFKHDIKQVTFNNKFIVFGLPVITTNYYNIQSILPQVPYSIHSVLFINMRRRDPIGKYPAKFKPTAPVIFKIKAQLECDIYDLFCYEDGTEILHGVAMIPDYKTSVMMNTLFRKIKENSNLDLLEESDSEEEFENIEQDKFVNLEKVLLMKCVYMEKFRKWKPIEIVPDNTKIVTKKNLYTYEKI